MEIRCPICGEICTTDDVFERGDALECPYCKKEFIYGAEPEVDVGTSLVAQKPKNQNSTLQSEDVFKRFYDPNILSMISFGNLQNLQDRSYWQRILVLLEISKPVPVVCDQCWRFNVGFFRDTRASIRCQCNNEFSANHGSEVLLSLMEAMRVYVKKGKYVWALHKKFNIEEDVFHNDWNALNDPKTDVRIARVKDELDRAYRRLQISETKKIVAATNMQSQLIADFASRWDSSFLQYGGLLGMLSYEEQQSELGLESCKIQEYVGRLESTVRYYYQIAEEFCGIDMETALHARLKARTGYGSEDELPKLYLNDDISKCELILTMVGNKINAKIRNTCRWVMIVFDASALLMMGVSAYLTLECSHAMSKLSIGILWIASVVWSLLWIAVSVNWSGRRYGFN